MKPFKQVMRVVYVLIVLSWLAMIFLFSNQPANHSNELSQGVTEKVIGSIENLTDHQFDREQWNHWIRKNAHFFIYCVLGILLMITLTAYDIRLWRAVMFSFGISVIYAISDEVHQLFVSGRGAQVRDVCIDSAGAALGIGLFALLYNLRYNSRKRQR